MRIPRFLLLVPGLLALAGAAGFAQQQNSGPAGTQADPFSMDLDTLLNTKVTTASKFAESLMEAAGIVSVVTQDELRRFGGTTLLQVLERVSGLSVGAAFSGDSSLITVRGQQTSPNAGQILILINGRPVREVLAGGLGSDILESFPIGILERVEIVNGPGSVLYGSDAFFGVINLITKKTDGAEFRVAASGGPGGEQSATEEILFERGDLSIVEGGQFHAWPRWGITYHALAGPAVSSQNVDLRENGLGTYLGVNYKNLSFMSSYTALEAPSFAGGIVGDTRLKRGFTDIGYKLRANSRWDMTFNLTYSRSVNEAPDFPSIHRDSDEIDLEWTNFVTITNRDRLTFGTVYNHIAGLETSTAVTPAVPTAQGSRNSMEGYVEYERYLTGRLKLVGGIQANKIGAIATKAVPRGGIVWNPWTRWTVKLLYGGAYTAPSLDATLSSNPGLKGNPSLLSQEVGTFDAQLNYQSHRFQASIDYFQSRQTNLIVLNVTAMPFTFYNYPAAIHFRGGEAEGKYYLGKHWFLTGSALYQANDSGSGVKNRSPTPNAVVKAGASYESERGATVSVFDAYQGHVPGYQSAINPPADAFQSLSMHARIDLSKYWLKNDSRGLALFLNADDLLNKSIWLPSSGGGPTATSPAIPGRTIFLGIEVWQKKDR